MIELEIQGLAQTRDGLLIEAGRIILAEGFALLRQRLQQGHHGILLTLVVQGPSRRRRGLEAALDACERFISVKVYPFVEGEVRPHFAAAHPRSAVVTAAPAKLGAAPAPAPAVPPVVAVKIDHVGVPPAIAASEVAAAPVLQAEPPAEPEFEFIQPTPRRADGAAKTAPIAPAPFVEVVPLAPDEVAVAKMLGGLEYDYPRIVPSLLKLQQSVVAGARESSLALAGQRVGAWVFAREYALDGGLDLRDALERLVTPALRALVEVDLQGMQLHIHDSLLCADGGPSGCSFFGGFVAGLLEPAVAAAAPSIIPVCCRSYGAGECVLAVAD